jgi:hypothetical protein
MTDAWVRERFALANVGRRDLIILFASLGSSPEYRIP